MLLIGLERGDPLIGAAAHRHVDKDPVGARQIEIAHLVSDKGPTGECTDRIDEAAGNPVIPYGYA